MVCNSFVLIIYLVECNLLFYLDIVYCEMKKIDVIWFCYFVFFDLGVID